MTTAKEPKQRFAILLPDVIQFRHTEDSTLFELSVVEIKLEDGQERVRNPRDTVYDDLTFHAYPSWHNGQPFEVTFFHPIEYRNVYSVDLEKAERMAKLLRKVRKIDLPVNPETFGQFIALVAPALGIHELVLPEDQQSTTARSYDDNRYRFLPIKYAQYHVDRLLNSLKESVRPSETVRTVAL